MFITPKARFENGLSESLKFQKAEKEGKLSRYNAKFEIIRSCDFNIKKKKKLMKIL